jgi:hypothetical protein
MATDGQAEKIAQIPGHKIRAAACKALTTERSVRNFLAGKPQKPILADRIARVLRTHGFIP